MDLVNKATCKVSLLSVSILVVNRSHGYRVHVGEGGAGVTLTKYLLYLIIDVLHGDRKI